MQVTHCMDADQVQTRTNSHIEHHACLNLAVIASLEQIDAFPELQAHAKANVLGQVLNKMSLLCILHFMHCT